MLRQVLDTRRRTSLQIFGRELSRRTGFGQAACPEMTEIRCNSRLQAVLPRLSVAFSSEKLVAPESCAVTA
ncbi:hypothetical protein ABIE64_001320 [Thalassospira sp. MBR-102]|jgi:hypothetical protein|nr:hypothetical protein KO164_0988 [Thalassospira sp. KO164]PXX34030.1 hypothetical protein C7967_10283 [Thalassospira sp. 11-3]SED84758.1 hypothetical protein SAMN04515623_0994 [Thalassospira permensis]